MMNILKDFIKEEKGQTMVEWIVILALILVVIIAVVRTIGEKGKTKAKQIENELK
ncbi:Flp family type IVb pilin [Alkaliphilus sp. B6464]|uniref:Flp family type IVb pilin n=1 Tax=Alkaliphilus sp. B6464 TaxID=2731219 RepID=UPI001BA75A91|nr:Flp family type IVb pilin [Alkaliphilus sp. B6464]QUH22022.1 Flp family type IVb pilin [Alkaliphilus sp. B6464]